MPCNCGKSRPKEALTSAAATALIQGQQLQGYKVTLPDGTESEHGQYVDAKIEANRTGGRLSEIRG